MIIDSIVDFKKPEFVEQFFDTYGFKSYQGLAKNQLALVEQRITGLLNRQEIGAEHTINAVANEIRELQDAGKLITAKPVDARELALVMLDQGNVLISARDAQAEKANHASRAETRKLGRNIEMN